MAGDLMINKSDKTIPVYKYSDWEHPNLPNFHNTQIGTIYKNEAFAFEYGEAGDTIVFRDNSGTVTMGYLPLWDKDGKPFDLPMSAFTLCTDYPYGTVEIDGETFYTFKFRRSEEIYTARGNRWGTVASGMRVACRSAVVGENHFDWKGINYVERSSDGAWIKVTGDGYNYGFVDIGLNQGSMPNTISMYGSW